MIQINDDKFWKSLSKSIKLFFSSQNMSHNQHQFQKAVTVGTVLNEGLVVARLGSGARLLVAGVALWLSAPPELRQGLAFGLVRQLHAGAAWDICTKHETPGQSAGPTGLQTTGCGLGKLLHYTELLCLCCGCLSVCTDCTAMNYGLSCRELKYIIAGKALVLIVFFFLL